MWYLTSPSYYNGYAKVGYHQLSLMCNIPITGQSLSYANQIFRTGLICILAAVICRSNMLHGTHSGCSMTFYHVRHNAISCIYSYSTICCSSSRQWIMQHKQQWGGIRQWLLRPDRHTTASCPRRNDWAAILLHILLPGHARPAHSDSCQTPPGRPL